MSADQAAIDLAVHEAVENIHINIDSELQAQSKRNESRFDALESLISNLAKSMSTETNSSAQSTSTLSPLSGTSTDNELSTPTPVTSHVSRVDTSQQPEKLTKEFTLIDYRFWRRKFTQYYMVNSFSKRPLAEQHIRLEGCISTDMLKHIKYVMDLASWHDMSIENILNKLECHFDEQVNVTELCVKFDKCCQKFGETFNDFFVRLRELYDQTEPCNHCNKQSCKDKTLITRVISGICDDEIRRKLLALHRPALTEILRICRAEEHANQESAAMAKATSSTVNTVKSRSRSHTRKHNKSGNSSRASSTNRSNTTKDKTDSTQNDGRKLCYRCGGSLHEDLKDCRAVNAKCDHCKKVGHFRSVCLSLKKEKANTNTISIKAINTKKAPTVKIKCTFDTITFTIVTLPDTGADETIISWESLSQAGITMDQLLHTNLEVVAANGNHIECYGSIVLTIIYNNIPHKVNAFVCPAVDNLILSWHACRDLNLLSPNYPLPHDNCSVNNISSQNSNTINDMKKQLLLEYDDVFSSHEHLQAMEGEPMQIRVNEDATSFCLYTARSIPYAWRDDVKGQLNEMVHKGIITPVDHPSDWVSPLVVVRKKNDKLRLCIDFTKLNAHVKRPTHPFKTPKDAVAEIPNSSCYFTTFDATCGYWQIPLHEDSQNLTTFITPFGRYKFLRAPMGLISTGDVYCQRGDIALDGIHNLCKVVDDILVFDGDYNTHLQRVRDVLERCRKNRITLNPSKFVFAKSEVDYVGYKVSKDGVAADKLKLTAIRDFPSPTNITELRSFFGLMNQFMDFCPNLSNAASPLRPLLSAKNEFNWTESCELAFDNVKINLCKPPILAHFDSTLPTKLYTDASRLKGLGFALLQLHNNHWRLVQCGSRFLTSAESRYATVELELLAISWAVRKCRLYLLGINFTVITDHKSLVTILNSYTLDAVENPRLQRLKSSLLQYRFHAEWQSGVSHTLADALSRAPVQQPDDSDHEMADINHIRVNSIIICHATAVDLPANPQVLDPLLKDLLDTATTDTEYCALINAIENDIAPADLPTNLRQYKGVFDTMSIVDGFILYNGHRLLIPRNIRRQILQQLHSSHQGIERTKRRARQLYYWPGINSDVENTVSACDACNIHSDSLQKETMYPAEHKPIRPFEQCSTDLFSCGSRHYLVYADQYSGWPCLKQYNSAPTSTTVKHTLIEFYRDYGTPVRLKSDDGPQYSSNEFDEFCNHWGVAHDPSSPHYPQSNGHAEAAVKAMKNIVKKLTTANGALNNDQLNEAILEWRNTPKADGLSPAQRLFGTPMRTRLPVHHAAFDSKWFNSLQQADEVAASIKHKQVDNYNEDARNLAPLSIGNSVRIQDTSTKLWDRVGIITTTLPYRRYLIKLPSGRVLARNRRHLRLITTITAESVTDDITTTSNEDRHVTIQEPKSYSRRERSSPSYYGYQ